MYVDGFDAIGFPECEFFDFIPVYKRVFRMVPVRNDALVRQYDAAAFHQPVNDINRQQKEESKKSNKKLKKML